MLSISGRRIPQKFLFDLNTLSIDASALNTIPSPIFGPFVEFHTLAEAEIIVIGCVATFIII